MLVPLHGKQFLVQMVNGLPYHVAPLAFFQTNTNQTGLLLDMITKAAGALFSLPPPPPPLFYAFVYDRFVVFIALHWGLLLLVECGARSDKATGKGAHLLRAYKGKMWWSTCLMR